MHSYENYDVIDSYMRTLCHQSNIIYYPSLCVFLVFPSFATIQPLPHREFIIDTDVGIDDTLAIIYLLHRTEITVKAITIEEPVHQAKHFVKSRNHEITKSSRRQF